MAEPVSKGWRVALTGTALLEVALICGVLASLFGLSHQLTKLSQVQTDTITALGRQVSVER